MKKYLFIGEERSELALRMGVTWADGRLAAKQLFDALDHCKIAIQDCAWDNWFEWTESRMIWFIKFHIKRGYTIVAMGRKVEKEMIKNDLPHIMIVHPAARGTIRKKENYFAHVKEKLCIK